MLLTYRFTSFGSEWCAYGHAKIAKCYKENIYILFEAIDELLNTSYLNIEEFFAIYWNLKVHCVIFQKYAIHASLARVSKKCTYHKIIGILIFK